jgi:hypothetical protein
MWAAYKLVAELRQDCFWFWRARDDEHGTTMNHVAMAHRESDELTFKVPKSSDEAQWTRVMTLTQAVAKSAARLANESGD